MLNVIVINHTQKYFYPVCVFESCRVELHLHTTTCDINITQIDMFYDILKIIIKSFICYLQYMFNNTVIDQYKCNVTYI